MSMTVKQLIAVLQEFNPFLEVKILHRSSNDIHNPDIVPTGVRKINKNVFILTAENKK